MMDITLWIYKLTVEEYFVHNLYCDIMSSFSFSNREKIFIISIASPTFSCLLWWQKVGRMKTNLLLRICKNIIHGIIVKLRQKWKPMIYRYSRERILTVICYGSKIKRLIYVRAFLDCLYSKTNPSSSSCYGSVKLGITICRIINQMYCRYYWYKLVNIHISFVSILNAHLLYVVPNLQFE